MESENLQNKQVLTMFVRYLLEEANPLIKIIVNKKENSFDGKNYEFDEKEIGDKKKDINSEENLEMRIQLEAHLKDQIQNLKKEVSNKTAYAKEYSQAVIEANERKFKRDQRKSLAKIAVHKFFIKSKMKHK